MPRLGKKEKEEWAYFINDISISIRLESSLILGGASIMSGAANVSMSVSRAIGQQSSTARSIRVKEQVPKPSAFESEIHPSHKS